MSFPESPQPPAELAADLSACNSEPIHIPGSIQPHGYLLAMNVPALELIHASANIQELLGRPVEQLLGRTVLELLTPANQSWLADALGGLKADSQPFAIPALFVETPHGPRSFGASVHQQNGTLILELEPFEQQRMAPYQDPYSFGRAFLNSSQDAGTVAALAQLAADEVKRITGFGRVLIYRFDENWHGRVVAEARDEEYATYLDLWFPASDIPEQARRLYRLNRTRLISDVSYQPVPIVPVLNPETGQPLDLSFSTLRSVSPVHVEYLKNMGMGSSMSISILDRNGELWGLIACHDHLPRRVPFDVRATCDFLAQILAVQIESVERRADFEQRIRLKSLTTQLLSFMAREEEFIQGLIKHREELLEFAAAAGAAVVFEGHCTLLGQTPTEEQTWRIVDWLISRGREEVYCTDTFSTETVIGTEFAGVASGLLAISISKLYRSYVLWFRPEVVQTVKWSGDPRKAVETTADGRARISPRKSFEVWKEIVRGRAIPWEPSEVEAVSELRNAIVGIVLRKAEELAQLTSELQRSNKELESFSYSISHDLRAPFRHIAGYAELLLQSPTAKLEEKDLRFVNTIIKSAHYAGTLVDNLLSFSQVGRATLHTRRVDMGLLAREVHRELEIDLRDRVVHWQISQLPEVDGDPLMLRLVWQNLLHNAIKYTRDRPDARIQVGADVQEQEIVFWVRDNGAGFDQRYADKLFGVFQRLHHGDRFEGTGIGLANVRRIVDRHGGRTWAEGQLEQGATFYFTLPRRKQ